MKEPRSSGSRRKGPAPVEAGSSLLAHDIKGLAARLGLLVQNLTDHYEDPLFKRTALDVLDGTVMHLKRLALDLREHQGRVMVKLRVDLNQLAAEAIGDARLDIAGDVELLEQHGEIPLVWGDAFLLRRAFSCAMDNALEAMQGRGLLTVTTRTVPRKGGSKVLVEIGDTGPGMSREFLLEKLFQPFASTKEDGMGLGAYTFRQVAMLHGGSVRIVSEAGVGTRVRFYFPADDA